jgi:hypothetical protein
VYGNKAILIFALQWHLFHVTKVVMCDEDKQETMTMSCFTKCGDMTMGPLT